MTSASRMDGTALCALRGWRAGCAGWFLTRRCPVPLSGGLGQGAPDPHRAVSCRLCHSFGRTACSGGSLHKDCLCFYLHVGGKSAHQELFEVILVAWKSDINFLCQAFEHFQLHCLSEGTNNHLYLRAAACSCRRGSSIVPWHGDSFPHVISANLSEELDYGVLSSPFQMQTYPTVNPSTPLNSC